MSCRWKATSFVLNGWLISLLVVFVLPDQSGSVLALDNNPDPGFIAIDCGLPAGSSGYTDSETSRYYVSDAGFIDTGENKNLSPAQNSFSNLNWQQLQNVRSFPSGKRNCYTLKPEQGKNNNYLIRATFLYGNYDKTNTSPTFLLYLGPNLWDILNFTESNYFVKEIIYFSLTDYINVCLINNGTGVPFISSLELRLLSDSIYRCGGYRSLDKWYRYFYDMNYLVSPQVPVRFKDDAYDRIWDPYNSSYPMFTTSSTLDSLGNNDYKPPASVMRSATANSGGVNYTWTPSDASAEFYVYMHFADIGSSGSSGSNIREFDIFVNDKKWSQQPIIPPKLSSTTIAINSSSLKGSNTILVSIMPTARSNLPPLLNAIEFYYVKDFSQSSTQLENVDAIKNIKEFYNVKKNWYGDPCLPNDCIWDGLNCSSDNTDNSIKITYLNLTSSGLAGTIAPALSNLSSLEFLDLSYNSLTGPIPEFLGDMPSLKTLNLAGNHLSGSIPKRLIEKNITGLLSLSIYGNAFDEGQIKGKSKKIIIPIIAAVVGALLVFLLGLLFLYLKFKRQRDQAEGAKYIKEESLNSSSRRFSISRRFTYPKINGRKFSNSEITSITGNFKKVLGRGGSGIVYQGYLEDGAPVAIKIISRSSTREHEFHTEVTLLMRIHHRNLASLVGFCEEGTTMALVYEYMANGNLNQHLSVETTKMLSWKERLQIAVDAAQGLEYLHNGCKPPIIHRDVKSANILLDENFRAKIADFGLSRILNESQTHVTTGVAGTRGYLDPEYHITGQLMEKSDVYSFGIVLLELITGHPAIMKMNKELIPLIQWVNPLLAKGNIQEIVDARLRGDFNINSAWKVLEVAIACVPAAAIQRPKMAQVLAELKECLETQTNYEISAGNYESIETVRTGDSMVFELNMAPSAR